MGVREGCYNEGLVISAFAEVQKDGYSFRCSFLGVDPCTWGFGTLYSGRARLLKV